jgi:Cu2+-containing amine oxidase
MSGNVIKEADWKVHWKLTEAAGVAIYMADYRGRRVIWEASLPYVTIDHQPQELALEDGAAPEAHGPFWIPLGERTLASDVRKNSFRGGFELAVDFAAGPYRYTQLWRFHRDGRVAPWLTIYGIGLHDGHTYHPHWRFDFDVDGALDDALEYYEEERWKRVLEEGWLPYTGSSGDRGGVWRQVDFGSGARVTLRPHHWEDAELFAIRYHEGEWPPFTPRSEAGTQPFPAAYVGSEPIDGEDVTLWYVAHVHYDAAFPFTSGPWIRCDGF